MRGAAGSFDFLQDVGRARSPDERFGVSVVVVDVVSDGSDEFFHVPKDPATKSVLSQITEESFHHVQPGRTGGSEMHMETRVPLEPALHLGVFVRAGVVADHV